MIFFTNANLYDKKSLVKVFYTTQFIVSKFGYIGKEIRTINWQSSRTKRSVQTLNSHSIFNSETFFQFCGGSLDT